MFAIALTENTPMSETEARIKEKCGSDTVNDVDQERRDLHANTGARPKEQRGPGTVKGGYQERTYTRIPSMEDMGARPKEQRGPSKVSRRWKRTRTGIKHISKQGQLYK